MERVKYATEINKELEWNSWIIRGMVINAITMLEKCIDMFLSVHFANSNTDGTEHLMNNVFATKFMTFENKRIIFNTITELPKYKEFKKKSLNGVHSKLDKFNKHRNNLAHFVIDLNPGAVERFNSTKEVTFLKFDKSIESETYTIEKADEIAQEIHDFIKPLLELINSMP